MRRAARRARSRLPDPSAVAAFLRDQVNDDGGFAGRGGRSDLYYTVFGLEALAALDEPPPASGPDFLRQFADLGRLDFVHANCLARCWGNFPADAPDEARRRQMLERIEQSRTPDGGYSHWPGGKSATAYGCILALGTYQDLDADARPPGRRDGDSATERRGELDRLAARPKVGALPHPERLLRCLQSLKTRDGGYVNEPGQSAGLTPATAAALTVQVELGESPDREAIDWLLGRHLPAGGFAAMPALPLADLLSTATALHALARAGADLRPVAESCLRFVLSLWSDGAFRAHGFDETPDCEYTFYGLLALGELSPGASTVECRVSNDW